jgi:malate synthase
MQVLQQELGQERMAKGRFDEATYLMSHLVTSDELDNFLTLKGYDYLV